MPFVNIKIKDVDANNIACDVLFGPELPKLPDGKPARMAYTNAQLVACDVLQFLQQIAHQINNRENRAAIDEAVKIDGW